MAILHSILTTIHTSIEKEERDKASVVNNLLRISVGVEDVEDLLEDWNRLWGSCFFEDLGLFGRQSHSELAELWACRRVSLNI